jgi:hypothetical protein
MKLVDIYYQDVSSILRNRDISNCETKYMDRPFNIKYNGIIIESDDNGDYMHHLNKISLSGLQTIMYQYLTSIIPLHYIGDDCSQNKNPDTGRITNKTQAQVIHKNGDKHNIRRNVIVVPPYEAINGAIRFIELKLLEQRSIGINDGNDGDDVKKNYDLQTNYNSLYEEHKKLEEKHQTIINCIKLSQ